MSKQNPPQLHVALMWRKRQPKVAEVFDSELDSFGRFAEKRVEIRQLNIIERASPCISIVGVIKNHYV